MTLLTIASVVLILTSAATLAFGWLNQNEQLIWTSIGFSIAAAAALAIAYFRSKRGAPRAGAPPAHVPGEPRPERIAAAELEGEAAAAWGAAWGGAPEDGARDTSEQVVAQPSEDAAAVVEAEEAAPERSEVDAGEPTEEARPAAATSSEELSPLDAGGEAAAVSTPAARPRSAPATGRGRSKPQPKHAPGDEVVAIPERKKFHRPECRYAKVAGGERMTRARARRRSYAACGICKP